jgi:hypothetical protein
VSEVTPPTGRQIPATPSKPRPETSPSEAVAEPGPDIGHPSGVAPSRQSRRSRPQQAVIIALIVALIGAAATITAALISRPSHGGPVTAVTGSITFPSNGAFEPFRKSIRASGTVQNLPAGHHLWLFLQYGSEQRYWAGDPNITVVNGRWSGTIFLGEAGPATLWLVDFGPDSLNVMNHSMSEIEHGFPTMLLAGDASIVTSAHFTIR